MTIRALHVASALFALACASRPSEVWTLEQVKRAPSKPAAPPPTILLVADTQYSVPHTDYDLELDVGGHVQRVTPECATQVAPSFYRHAAANFLLPDALEATIAQARAAGARFGIFGGDMIEFACVDEADKIFQILERQAAAHPKFPFVITLGNHDTLFHGSYDADARGLGGKSAWEVYIRTLWERVCSPHGGPMDKTRMIRRILEYYRSAWDFAIRLDDSTLPGTPVNGDVVNDLGWRLTFVYEQGGVDPARAHRQSYLWQRFSFTPPAPRATEGEPSPAIDPQSRLTFTVLDSTDYDVRAALCERGAEASQIGMNGALSSDQVQWVADLPPVRGRHFLVSHYLPFQDVQRVEPNEDAPTPVGECDLTAGASCGWGKIVSRLLEAEDTDLTLVYGHVHRPFETQSLKSDQISGELAAVQLPSLIDQASYVLFQNGDMTEVEHKRKDGHAGPKFESEEPFASYDRTKSLPMCRQRHRELVELERNVDCFLDGSRCSVTLAAANGRPEVRARADQICTADASQSSSGAWITANPALAATAQAPQCKEAPQQRWRCILRALGLNALERVPSARRYAFATAALGETKTVRKKPARLSPECLLTR